MICWYKMVQAVCLVLNFLLDRLLVKKGFRVQAPIYSAGEYREEEVATDDGDADVVDDIKDEVTFLTLQPSLVIQIIQLIQCVSLLVWCVLIGSRGGSRCISK
jgi:hypothetical protein